MMKLSEALLEAARRLEAGLLYEFVDAGSCNCGVLAQVLTGLDRQEVCRRAYRRQGPGVGHIGLYSVAVGTAAATLGTSMDDACALTGMDEGSILRALGDAGMTPAEVCDLEHMTEDHVLRRMERLKPYDDVPTSQYVAAYMRAWAGVLEEEGR